MDTTTTVVVVLVVVIALALLLALLARRKRQTSALQERFGPEYERTVADADSRRDAERELRDRERAREELELRPLEPGRRTAYADQWRLTQEDFVDRPAEAVSEAQQLVSRVMRDRGYPVGDAGHEERVLSVDHAEVMQEYRSAREISELNDRQAATTEQLRQAMVHYRSLFSRLLDDGPAGRQDADEGDGERPGGSDGERPSGRHATGPTGAAGPRS